MFAVIRHTQESATGSYMIYALTTTLYEGKEADEVVFFFLS